jgi:hypothetical protein
VLLLVAAAPARALEPAEGEKAFLDGLRARGYAGYALLYLEDLNKKIEDLNKKKATLPRDLADLVAALPLEFAKTRMILAQNSPLEKRLTLYNQARDELQAYVTANQGNPEAVRQAKMEIARIVALQGKAQLSTAIRQETVAARKEEAIKARHLFESAGKELNSAIKLLDAQMLKYKDSKKDEDVLALESLEKDKFQAEFDLALNVLLQSQTYILCPGDADIANQGKLAEQAEAKLKEFSGRDEDNPLCLKARAWLIPCALTTTEPKKALDVYNQTFKTIKVDAKTLDAKFLADYFHLALVNDPLAKIKNPLAHTKKAGTDWLKSRNLSRFGDTPEGYGVWIKTGSGYCFVPSTAEEVKQAVRLTVALAAYQEAKALKKSQWPTAKKLYEDARTQLNALEATESDLTPTARNLNLDIFVALRKGKIKLDELKTFKEFYYQARNETRYYYSSDKPNVQKKHLRNVALALQRALDVADSSVPRHDLIKAGSDLTDIYLNLGDRYRAAVMGEHVARTNPPSRETAHAAAFALEAYLAVLRQDQARLRKYWDLDDKVLTRDVLVRTVQSDRDQFRNFALFVESEPAWQDEIVSQYARYQRALLALQDRDYPAAIAILQTLKPSYPAYPVSQCNLILAALQLTEEGAARSQEGKLLGFTVSYRVPLTDKEKEAYQKLALAALQKLPPVTPQSSPYHFHMYFVVRLKQCKIMYRDKQFTELDKFVAQLRQQFAGVVDKIQPKVNDDLKNDLLAGFDFWTKYALLGQADHQYSLGNYEAVLNMTADTLNAVRQKVKENKPGSLKDFLYVRDILELALRSNVQTNNRKGAREILSLLQTIASNETLTGVATGIKPTEILVRLVLQLRAQVNDLRNQGEAKEAQLAKTVENFSAFLDELTKDLDTLTKELDKLSQASEKKNLKQRILGLLARSYASLDKHKQAAELLKLIPVPQVKGKKKPKPADLPVDYLESQLLYVQELRKAKQFEEAEKVLNKLGLKLEGKYTLDKLIVALDAEKERILLLEAREEYGKAISAWTRFMKNPRLRGLRADVNFRSILLKIKDENDRKKVAERFQNMYQDVLRLHYECYYHKTYCIYKYGVKMNKPDFVKLAASNIHKLKSARDSEGWKFTQRDFRALLKAEPQLNKAFEALEKEAMNRGKLPRRILAGRALPRPVDKRG